LTFIISATPDIAESAQNYYLVGLARGIVCYAAKITLKKSAITTRIAKNIFPSGIVHFTLLNADNHPVNERIVYIDHNDNLQIRLSQNKTAYGIRDSVALQIQVEDKRREAGIR
jgi:hypothetical protein